MRPVIVLGQRDAGDDAAGPLVGDALRAQGFEVLEPADVAELAEALARACEAIVVDAAIGPGRPGTVFRLDGAAQVLPAAGPSYHGFGLAEAIAFAEALGATPDLTVFAVVGADFSYGAPLSAPVAEALPALVEEIRRCA